MSYTTNVLGCIQNLGIVPRAPFGVGIDAEKSNILPAVQFSCHYWEQGRQNIFFIFVGLIRPRIVKMHATPRDRAPRPAHGKVRIVYDSRQSRMAWSRTSMGRRPAEFHKKSSQSKGKLSEPIVNSMRHNINAMKTVRVLFRSLASDRVRQHAIKLPSAGATGPW